MFAVDTRLRPNGAGGPLVLTESSFKDFSRVPLRQEGMAYMKSRAVAGDASPAERFEGTAGSRLAAHGQAGVRGPTCGACVKSESEQGVAPAQGGPGATMT
jgi:glutamine synthetase adenylyltransferase